MEAEAGLQLRGFLRVGTVGSKCGCCQLCSSVGSSADPLQAACLFRGWGHRKLGLGKPFGLPAGIILPWISSYLFWQTWELSPAFCVPVSAFLSCLLLHFFLLPRLSFLSPPCSLGWVPVRQTLAKGNPSKEQSPRAMTPTRQAVPFAL